MDYRLLALDMDGTVLTSEKVISPRTDAAIRRAMAAGEEVLFATGRAPAEMRAHLAKYPEMHYIICLSGATVMDLREKRDLNVVSFRPEVVDQIMSIGSGYDALAAVYAGEDVFLERRYQGRLGYFGCECFAKLYDQCAIWVEDISQAIAQRKNDVRKINFYFHMWINHLIL